MGSKNGLAVLDTARRLAGSRELVLTLTHFHPEHGYGAEPFKGEAEILYNCEQARELADKGEGYPGMFKRMGPSIAEALEGTTLVEADTLYDGASHEIDLGGRRAILRTWGKAHTRGDQIVFLPDDGILFTGDLAEEKTFPIFPWFPPEDTDISAANWIAVLDGCLMLRPSLVVPGHGEIGGSEIISGVRDYIVSLGGDVLAARRSGKTPDQIIAELGRRYALSIPAGISRNGSILPSDTMHRWPSRKEATG